MTRLEARAYASWRDVLFGIGNGTGFDPFGDVRWYRLCLLSGGFVFFVGLLVWNECCTIA